MKIEKWNKPLSSFLSIPNLIPKGAATYCDGAIPEGLPQVNIGQDLIEVMILRYRFSIDVLSKLRPGGMLIDIGFLCITDRIEQYVTYRHNQTRLVWSYMIQNRVAVFRKEADLEPVNLTPRTCSDAILWAHNNAK
jgi:hypothetical protein